MGNHLSQNFTITDIQTQQTQKTGYFYFIKTYDDLQDFIIKYFGLKVSRIFVLDKKQRLVEMKHRLFDFPTSIYIEIEGITRREFILTY